MNNEDRNYFMLLGLTLLIVIIIGMYFLGECGVNAILRVMFRWWKV